MAFAYTNHKSDAIYMMVGFILFKCDLCASTDVGTVLQHGRNQSDTDISY
jgi:hypothetical protein